MVQSSLIAEWSVIQMVSSVFKWWFEYQTFHFLNTGLLKVRNLNGSVIQMSGIRIVTVFGSPMYKI